MALVDSGYRAQFTLVDNGGKKTTKTYQLRAADMATAVTDAAAILLALNAVTNSVVSTYNIANVFKEAALSFPAEGIRNADKMSLSVELETEGGKLANLRVPAPVIGCFIDATGPGANIVNTAASIVTDYCDLFKTGAEAFISDGEDLQEVLSGVRISATINRG